MSRPRLFRRRSITGSAHCRMRIMYITDAAEDRTAISILQKHGQVERPPAARNLFLYAPQENLGGIKIISVMATKDWFLISKNQRRWPAGRAHRIPFSWWVAMKERRVAGWYWSGKVFVLWSLSRYLGQDPDKRRTVRRLSTLKTTTGHWQRLGIAAAVALPSSPSALYAQNALNTPALQPTINISTLRPLASSSGEYFLALGASAGRF